MQWSDTEYIWGCSEGIVVLLRDCPCISLFVARLLPMKLFCLVHWMNRAGWSELASLLSSWLLSICHAQPPLPSWIDWYRRVVSVLFGRTVLLKVRLFHRAGVSKEKSHSKVLYPMLFCLVFAYWKCCLFTGAMQVHYCGRLMSVLLAYFLWAL